MYRMIRRIVGCACVAASLVWSGAAFGVETASSISFTKDIVPILRANCNGCHKPGKTKGDLDLTTHAAIMAGGKNGPTLIPGDPDSSMIVEEIVGDPPNMPEEGDPLKAAEIELIKIWIAQGAVDDTPDETSDEDLEPPVYAAAPVITSIAYSPDGKYLAVAGYSEVLVHNADGSGLVARLVGRAQRVEGLAFSHDGKLLAVCGGSPGEFGHVQFWDTATGKKVKSYRISYDSLYGISFAPDDKSVAFGGADKVVRQIDIETGETLLDFRAHADWVFGTAFTLDGKQLVSAGRDQAMKLIDLETQRFVDDINNPKDKIVCFTRHPKEPQVAYGGHLGGVRMYKISDNQNRTAGRNDTNMIREFPKQNGPAHAVSFSPDGTLLAVGATGEARVYSAADGGMKYVLSGHEGPVYAISWSPDGEVLATAGFDGMVRLFSAADGKPNKEFVPVPLGRTAEAPEGPTTGAVAEQN